MYINYFRNPGFTLVELLCTLTIAAVVMAYGIPYLTGIIRQNQLTTFANTFVSSLNMARSEAIRRGVHVSVRQVDSNSFTKQTPLANWEDGWDVFVDNNANGKYDASGGDLLIKTFPGLLPHYTIRGNSPFAAKVTFNPSGGSGSGRIVICEDSDNDGLAEPYTSRLVTLVTTGRIRVMPDTDIPPNGIPDLASGQDNTLCDP